MKKTALVAGPFGIVGTALVRNLVQSDEWDIVTVSRRAQATEPGVKHLAIDLLDTEATEAALSQFPEITHIFYCAYAPRPTPMEEVEPNLLMLKNLVLNVEKFASELKRVVLVHGTKWYGNHLGPFRTPAREDDARHLPPNFYYDQHDWIERQQKSSSWSWTSFRPHGIFGYAKNSPMNHLMALVLYSWISKDAGNYLKFPGHPVAFTALNQYTDAGLLARAMVWSIGVLECENQAFNINNGEPERWSNIWPKIANIFEIPEGDVQQVSLAQFMPANEHRWKRICELYDLEYNPMADYINWSFADWVYANTFDQISSLHKIRQAGWTEVLSFEDMLRNHLADLRKQRLIP